VAYFRQSIGLSHQSRWAIKKARRSISVARESRGTHKTARIWDAGTGAQLAVLTGHRERIRFAAYSPDGTRIITASHDKTVRIWDARTGAQLGRAARRW
jgi:WD40 repeat protein